MAGNTLLLVDGTGLVYRAFHAIPMLSTPDGRPTNAVVGFTRLLRQLRQWWQPSHLGIVFDGGTPAARLAALPTYKAQRAPMPEELRCQWPAIDAYVQQAGLYAVRLEGEEADDVIATLATQARAEAATVLIATSDKDFCQLVEEQLVLVAPAKARERIGPAEVLAKTGVRPDQQVDWQALTGDAVDNIPGVPGIGPKTAARLLQQFGSLDALWTGLAQVESARVRELLAAHRERVQTNVMLMRLRRDLPVRLDWVRMRVRPEAPPPSPRDTGQLEFTTLQ